MQNTYIISVDTDEDLIYIGKLEQPDAESVSYRHCTFEQALNEATLKLKDKIYQEHHDRS